MEAAETTLGSGEMQRIVNVTTPTLTAYLPDPATATGTAVIIAPGGGFIFLGTDTHDVAKWLVARGIAAFVLKYRTAQIEGQNEAQLNQSGGARFGAQLRDHALIAEDGKYGIADGIQAIKVVRAHAAEWGVSPDRIVFMGFSAGGMITEFTAVQPDVSARPNYAAPIYGAPFPSHESRPPWGDRLEHARRGSRDLLGPHHRTAPAMGPASARRRRPARQRRGRQCGTRARLGNGRGNLSMRAFGQRKRTLHRRRRAW